jgi:hypothetical protein
MPVYGPKPTPTIPGGSITIDPGDNIQAIVDANPAGSVYKLTGGTHRLHTITPKDGDHFIGDDDVRDRADTGERIGAR